MKENQKKNAEMKKYSNIVQKALVGSVIFTCVCLSTQAQTAEQLAFQKQEMLEAREWIKQHGFNESAVLSDGRVIGLVGIRDGIPQYNTTFNAGAADTISVDELWPNGSSGPDRNMGWWRCTDRSR